MISPPAAPLAGLLSAPDLWPGRDGMPIACREKLAVLAENHAEIVAILRDSFDDAALMGVDEAWFRALLHRVVDGLAGPRRGAT